MAIRMKMKQKKMRKIGIASALGLVVLVMLGLYGASNYMLNYSLNYPKEERMTAEHWKNRMKNECPWMIGWMDSVYQHHCVKDTFVTMPSGYKAHAIYLYAPKTTEKTAVVVHGYQVRSEGMLHIAYLYNHDMGYNVLLPDLYGHGESEGDHIQMGWKDRWDVIRWSESEEYPSGDSRHFDGCGNHDGSIGREDSRLREVLCGGLRLYQRVG